MSPAEDRPTTDGHDGKPAETDTGDHATDAAEPGDGRSRGAHAEQVTQQAEFRADDDPDPDADPDADDGAGDDPNRS